MWADFGVVVSREASLIMTKDKGSVGLESVELMVRGEIWTSSESEKRLKYGTLIW